jgi:hypothetical protein
LKEGRGRCANSARRKGIRNQVSKKVKNLGKGAKWMQ